jgi:hypothetical protein
LPSAPNIINIDEDGCEGDVVGHTSREQFKVLRMVKVFAMFSFALFLVGLAHVLQATGDPAVGGAAGLTALALSLAMILEGQANLKR